MKTCPDCGCEKELSEFAMNSSRKSHQHYCMECSRSRKRQWYAENRDRERAKIDKRKRDRQVILRQEVWDYLSNNPCVDCGEPDPMVLEFDHVKPGKTVEVTALIGRQATLERLYKEIELCEIRCANCHKRKTNKEFGWWKTKMVPSYNGSTQSSQDCRSGSVPLGTAMEPSSMG